MYTVRFNLGRGDNYMKWKIENLYTKEKVYLDPSEVSIVMSNCKLKNRINQATKIFNGDNKTVCAWVLCERVGWYINNKLTKTNKDQIRYNPREFPNWRQGEDNVDNKTFKQLLTINKNIYIS